MLALSLAGCGGGSTPNETSADPSADTTAADTTSTTLTVDIPVMPDDAAAAQAQPLFHVAAVLPDAPDGSDADDPGASAHRPPQTQTLPPGLAGLSTRRLTLEALDAMPPAQRLAGGRTAGDGAAPLATTSSVATYTPAQVRAAYGLPPLPAVGATLSADQAAALGAGQTTYIIGARHNPNLAAELAAFNQRFGLPACTTRAIGTTASLPLAAPPAAACDLSVVYTTAAGVRTSTAPAYDANWATELALDVQWTHATAPLARLVVIEAPDPSTTSLQAAVQLANAMGSGTVSMSFGAPEGSYTASTEAAFSAAGMTYLAATGDNGAAVSWPAVSPRVLAVGGTTLRYAGSGARSEVAWSGTGGGTSAFTTRPAYQTNAVPGLVAATRRTVADVAFNADPNSGQFVAVMPPGSSSVRWLTAGGTSLAAPQWAGLVAVANALRKRAGKPALGAPHAALYGAIATVPGSYAASFADITSGSHGSCATCSARAGHDQLTGLGTPQVPGLLSALTGATAAVAPPPAPAPVAPAPLATAMAISAAPLKGVVGKALSGSFSVSAPGATRVTMAVSGVPAGMVLSASGLTYTLRWAKPVLGSRTLALRATDNTGRVVNASLLLTVTAK